jgi:2-oxo-4-hydroxy-4-carboxy-5-ureidoimidazoline decarboxylase
MHTALAWLNGVSAAEAERALLACCASTAWAGAVVAARPFGDPLEFRGAVEAALAALTWADIGDALSAHPRLGERPAGADRSATWSAGEQAGVAAAGADTKAALAAGNLAYEARFGHVYLACATGRGGADLLALLRSRLDNDPATERAVVRDELTKITWLRLGKLLTETGAPETGTAGAPGAGAPGAGGPGSAERAAAG